MKHPGPMGTDEPTAGTETFVVPGIGNEGCGCEWKQIDYYAPVNSDYEYCQVASFGTNIESASEELIQDSPRS